MSCNYKRLRAPQLTTEQFLYEVLRGLGALPHPWRRRLLRALFTPPVRLFAASLQGSMPMRRNLALPLLPVT